MIDLPPKHDLWLPARPALVRAASDLAIPQIMRRVILPSAQLVCSIRFKGDVAIIRDHIKETERVVFAPMVEAVVTPILAPFYKQAAGGTRTHVHTAEQTTTNSTQSFAGCALGTPVGTSLVAVVFCAWNGGTNGTAATGCNIDGSAATVHQNANGLLLAGNCSVTLLASRATSNTSGTISATFNTNMLESAVMVYRLNSLSSATISNSNKASTTGATSINANLNVPSSGVAIAGAGAVSTTGGGMLVTGTGITQDVQDLVGANNWRYGSASAQGMAANAALTITADWTAGSSTGALVMGAWA